MKKTYNTIFVAVGAVAIAATAYTAMQLGGYEISPKDTDSPAQIATDEPIEAVERDDFDPFEIDTSAYDHPEEGKPLRVVTSEGIRYTYHTPWLFVRPDNVKGNNDYWWTDRPRFSVYIERREEFPVEEDVFSYTQAEFDADATAVNVGEDTEYATTMLMENGYYARFWWDGDEGVGLVPRYDFYVNNYRIRVETLLDAYIDENNLSTHPVINDYSLVPDYPELEEYMNEFKAIADSFDFSAIE